MKWPNNNPIQLSRSLFLFLSTILFFYAISVISLAEALTLGFFSPMIVTLLSAFLLKEKVGISVECSLGFLTKEQATKLKELKVKRYNHNLETAESKFSEICTTHTYQDRLDTLEIAREAGLELCTGGIIGLGETREQRIEMTLELARIYPEEVTINILVPVPGTPLELQVDLPNSEITRIFSVIRFLLPESVIKISGGRETNLDDSGEELLQSGANGIITQGYLTMDGNDAQKDRKMIEKIGLEA